MSHTSSTTPVEYIRSLKWKLFHLQY
uniref:Uncharacterized protein n=1 Tax=Anguilla anguilla TaxID=7936 RepID=A0A0E9U1R2_ANGAN